MKQYPRDSLSVYHSSLPSPTLHSRPHTLPARTCHLLIVLFVFAHCVRFQPAHHHNSQSHNMKPTQWLEFHRVVLLHREQKQQHHQVLQHKRSNNKKRNHQRNNGKLPISGGCLFSQRDTTTTPNMPLALHVHAFQLKPFHHPQPTDGNQPPSIHNRKTSYSSG